MLDYTAIVTQPKLVQPARHTHLTRISSGRPEERPALGIALHHHDVVKQQKASMQTTYPHGTVYANNKQ